MQGELLWFNEARQDGVIRTESGEDVVVLGRAFPGGSGPVGRCGGTPVRFEVSRDGEEPQALSVTYLTLDPPRRARSRSRR